jgi:hypothetical protein
MYDWTLLNTLVFIVAPFFIMLALSSNDDEDDGPGGGLMTPVYQGTGA